MSKKRKQKNEAVPDALEPQKAPEGEQGSETGVAAIAKPKGRKAKAKTTQATDGEQGSETVAEATKPKGRRAMAAKRTEPKTRVERETILNLEPTDDIKPIRAGTHLGNVVELTARPEGATAVELDKAIVTTAKSVKHYGIWALRYPLHKNKGYGFRSVHPDGGPARYHLVLPKALSLEALLTAPAAERKKAPKPELIVRRTTKASKSHGKKAAEARA